MVSSAKVFSFFFIISTLLFSCELPLEWYTEPDESPVTVNTDINYPELPFTNSRIPGNYPAGSPVAIHGNLKVIGTQLCDERGFPVQLRGLYMDHIKDSSQFLNNDSIKYLSRKYKMDVFRIPLWTIGWSFGKNSEPGYIHHPEVEKYIHEAVRYTENSGIYCIVSWHIMYDGDPNTYIKEAFDFFKRMAFLYGAKKHVIYEIFNEPNQVKWGSKIKPYAQYIIPAIRAGSSNSVIIVGTEFNSFDLHHAAASPLKYDNILYTIHYYPGLFPLSVTNRVKDALSHIAVFCTEWGVTDLILCSIRI
jgi:endoglucanase